MKFKQRGKIIFLEFSEKIIKSTLAVWSRIWWRPRTEDMRENWEWNEDRSGWKFQFLLWKCYINSIESKRKIALLKLWHVPQWYSYERLRPSDRSSNLHRPTITFFLHSMCVIRTVFWNHLIFGEEEVEASQYISFFPVFESILEIRN